jgi:DNA-binding MarR family transcriptional regulator
MRSALGITGPQRLVLRMVGRSPGISAGQLASLLRVHPSTLTGILERLEQQGLIIRRSDPNDHRRALLRLSDKGTELDADSTGTVEAAIRTTLSMLAPKEVRAAAEVLRHLTEVLESAQWAQRQPPEPE